MTLLVAGIVLSLLGSLPPGLIGLTVSQTSLLQGFAAAMAVALGAAVAEFFQAWAAVLLSDWFLSHPSAELAFRWAAVAVFLVLGGYLVFFAQKPSESPQTLPVHRRNYFGKGLVISLFNMLALPYWFVYCAWLRVEGWWQEGVFPTLIFSFGVSVGTLLAMLLYAWLGQWALRQSGQLARYTNLFIGLVLWFLALKTLSSLL